MAPPARRAGFSRRAQYSLFASYVVAVAGIVAGLLLALTARFYPQAHEAVQARVADLTAPISSAGRDTLAGLSALWGGAAAYIEAGSKNRALEAELRATRSRILEAQALARENERLRRLVRLVETTPQTVATARLVASTGASARRYATLSAGASSGVANGQPVRTSEGLVGRVVAVGRSSARVLLIGDSGNVVPVMRLTDGLPALATGRGDGTLDLRAVQANGNPFKLRDVFVTSGAGGLYPPGVPVSRVVALARDAAVGRPIADPARLDLALVQTPFVPPAPDLPPPADTP